VKNLIGKQKYKKMNSLFLSWSKRNLSILGKVLIIKALIIPIFTFRAMISTDKTNSKEDK
jgi:hypothetical protein